jgi:hypothetical protein
MHLRIWYITAVSRLHVSSKQLIINFLAQIVPTSVQQFKARVVHLLLEKLERRHSRSASAWSQSSKGRDLSLQGWPHGKMAPHGS